jgi:hypothetical protein
MGVKLVRQRKDLWQVVQSRETGQSHGSTVLVVVVPTIDAVFVQAGTPGKKKKPRKPPVD